MKRACVLAAIIACVWTGGATAQSRVIVRSFSGTDSGVRDAVVQMIAETDGLQMVTNKDADGAAQSSSADLTTEAGRVAVARALTVSAFVEGDVQKRAGTTDVSLHVFNGRDGALLTVVGMHAPDASVNAEVQKRVRSDLGDAIRRGQPPLPLEPLPPPPAPAAPAPPEPKPAPMVRPRPPPAPAAFDSDREPPANAKRYALEIGAGLVAVSRNFTYRDALLKLPELTGSPTPALRIDARWYPAAHLTKNVLSQLGLELNAQVMWPSDAERNNTKFTTTSTDFGVAARGRIPLAEHELGVLVGYGGHTFTIDDQNGVDPGVPNVSYGFVRFGADARLQLHKIVRLGLGLEYLALTRFGEIGEQPWFPHVSGGGVAADLDLAFDVSDAIQLVVSGGVTRYYMSLNPRPTDAGVSQGRIAGGAADQYVFGLFGLRLRPY